jgi:hypothetical protein
MMDGIPLGMAVEGAVAILLILTIGYCIVLNHRLKRLHSDRETLRQMVTDLVQATNLANSAVMELKTAAGDADDRLARRIEEADSFLIQFANHITSGRALMEKIAKITTAARPAAVAEVAAEPNKLQSALAQLAARTKVNRGQAA